MRKNLPCIGMLLCYALVCNIAAGQDSTRRHNNTLYDKLYSLPDKAFNSLNDKSEKLQARFVRQTQKYLSRLSRREHNLREKLWKKDSVAAKEMFGNIDERYAALQQKLNESTPADQLHGVYSNRLDSMTTALSFLQNSSFADNIDQQKIQSALSNYKGLHSKLDQTSYIKNVLQERQQYLQSRLESVGLGKELMKFKKDVYYYREQMNEYRKTLEDPSKMEAKLLELARKVPAFKKFFGKYSELAALFGSPGSEDGLGSGAIAGLQTREMVNQNILQRLGADPDMGRAMQQNLQSAHTQLDQLKDRFKNAGSTADGPLPDFKPNTQKTKGFLKRLEFGTNIQTVRGSNYFPVTSDLGLSIGYKLNDKFSLGLGTSYKMGWGSGFGNIRITHEGVGLRSYIDGNIKGSFYVSGGFEYNYQKPFNSIYQLYAADNWQQSGLLGISKIISIKSKIFSKTKVQLLWDFLSYRQVPRTQPLKFRIGYSLK